MKDRDQQHRNVLLVDDDPSIRRLFRALLSRTCTVREAASGEQAVEIATLWPPDLVLLDIMLPDCMGYELIPQFKARWHDIGIVTMTGYNSQELELKVRQQGITYYMLKPFNMKDIKDILDHISKKEKRR